MKPYEVDMRPGDTIRVSLKVKEGEKTRTQVFEGLVLAHKHGRGVNGTITVRKVSFNIGVERVFPLHSPAIEKIEIVRRASRVRRAKLYYIRDRAAKEMRRKMKQVRFEAPPEVVEKKEEAEEVKETEKVEAKA